MSHLRGFVWILEIVFVGQCEVFVCLDFVQFFSPLTAKLWVRELGVNSLKKNVNFFPIPTTLIT